jgi:hypothetical protein
MGTGFCSRAEGFSRIEAYARAGGRDTAYYGQIATGDVVRGSGTTALWCHHGTDCLVQQFEEVIAEVGVGQMGYAQMDALDFYFYKLGNWRL